MFTIFLTLGSLYQDEISVEPAEVIPILATASLLTINQSKFTKNAREIKQARLQTSLAKTDWEKRSLCSQTFLLK